jgi:hypothetical protein
MSVDCQWVEKNLEALFCDRLGMEESRRARTHIENCVACRREVQALNAIDPLIRNHFHDGMAIARQPRVLHKGRAFGIGSAAAAVIVLAIVLLIRAPQPASLVPSVAALPNEVPVASVEIPVKADPGEPVRAKPSPEPGSPDRRPVVPPAAFSNTPDFLVADPAGYSHTLEEYRGRVVLVGVWKSGMGESIAAIEQLYKAYAGNPKLRFIGVSTDHQPRPANTTFPVLYNQGSKLFGAAPGEFVLLNQDGAVELRGSLLNDFESIRRTLQSK